MPTRVPALQVEHEPAAAALLADWLAIADVCGLDVGVAGRGVAGATAPWQGLQKSQPGSGAGADFNYYTSGSIILPEVYTSGSIINYNYVLPSVPWPFC